MKKTNQYLSLLLALVCLFSLSLTSCSKDDDEKPAAPTVVLTEANIEDGEICVMANIIAPGRTANIIITVTDPTGTVTKLSQPITEAKYMGVLNIDEFHVHVKDIDSKSVVKGDLLRLSVTDQNSRSTTAQMSITEEEEEE